MRDLRSRFPIYSRLIALYPAPYRTRYSAEILQTLADMLDARRTRRSRLSVWSRVVVELPGNVFVQHMQYISEGLLHETPNFVRRNSILSTLAFLPFLIIAISNDVASHRLYRTWLWHVDVLNVWLLALPFAGLALSAGTLAIWLRRNKRRGLQGLTDVHHNWPMVVLTVLGIAILSVVLLKR